MPAAMIDDRQGITASWAIFQRHAPLIAGFGAIARSLCTTARRFQISTFCSKLPPHDRLVPKCFAQVVRPPRRQGRADEVS